MHPAKTLTYGLLCRPLTGLTTYAMPMRYRQVKVASSSKVVGWAWKKTGEPLIWMAVSRDISSFDFLGFSTFDETLGPGES